MKLLLKNSLGIIIAASYALVLRIIFNYPHGHSFWSLFSITFVWIVPIIIGIIPIFFADNDQIKSLRYWGIEPPLAVLVFLIVSLITRIEDLICIIIIGLPFFLVSWASGLVVVHLIEKYRKSKGLMCFVFLVPFVLSPVEQQIPTPSDTYKVTSSVIINSTPEEVWNNIIRVRQIKKTEYSKGFFNYIGIPRPLYAELDKDTSGATRIGHFEGGLTFIETVTNWEKYEEISFNIKVNPPSIRQTVFDQHVLKGEHFRFLNASYQIKKLHDGKVKLTLISSYQLDTKINSYGAFWGNMLLSDFQDRLLKVLRSRCE